MEIHAGKIRSGKVHGLQVGVRQLDFRTSEQRRQSDCAPRSAVPNELESVASFHGNSRFVGRLTTWNSVAHTERAQRRQFLPV
jgi:hypothetical protein